MSDSARTYAKIMFNLNLLSDRRVLAGAGVLLIVILVSAVVIYRSANERYYLTSTSSGASYKIDRRTGKTWQIRGTLIHEVNERKASTPEPELIEVPPDILSQIQGDGGYARGTSLFSGTLYNGSQWHIRRVRLMISAKPTEGEPRWSRYFLDDVILWPESSGGYQVDTVDGDFHKATDWNVVSAWGYK